MSVKLYVDMMSQPSRAVAWFAKIAKGKKMQTSFHFFSFF